MNLVLALGDSNRFVCQKVMGNSMDPTYRDGDMIIADTHNKMFIGGGVFMIDMNKNCGTNIARLIDGVGGIRVIKDNYPGQVDTLPIQEADTLVIGKIVGHVYKEVLGE